MSTINDTDVFLINRGTASYKCQANQLLDKVTDTDFLLVNRGSTSYKVAFSNANDDILDTDWLLINRGSTSYKVSGADFKTLLGQTFGWELDANDAYWSTSWIGFTTQRFRSRGIASNKFNETLVAAQSTAAAANGTGSAITGWLICFNSDGTVKWFKEFKGKTVGGNSDAFYANSCFAKSDGDFVFIFNNSLNYVDSGTTDGRRLPNVVNISRSGTVGTITKLLSGNENNTYTSDCFQIHERSNGKFLLTFSDDIYKGCYAELESNLSLSTSSGRVRRYNVANQNLSFLHYTSTYDSTNDKLYVGGKVSGSATYIYNYLIKQTPDSTVSAQDADWCMEYQASTSVSNANAGFNGMVMSNGNPVVWIEERWENSGGSGTGYGADIILFKVNPSNGAIVWRLRIGGDRNASTPRQFYSYWRNNMDSDKDGNLYLACRTQLQTGGTSYWGMVIKVSASGTFQWCKRFRTLDGNYAARAPFCANAKVDATGNIAFEFNDAILKLNSDGNWNGTYNNLQEIQVDDYTPSYITSSSGDFGTWTSISNTKITTSGVSNFSTTTGSIFATNTTLPTNQNFTVPE